ncbi:MAG: WxcM-like domain-containing protein [Chlorobi bacterium]|nr:WxcM-like domain-containing protein [Chlorobiota bacterium]
MDKPRLLEFQRIGNEEIGYISVAEHENLPFVPKRFFWTYNVPEHIVRGGHAHKELEQIIIAIAGKLEIKVYHKGETYEFVLDNPNVGLYLPPLSWNIIRFHEGAILFCAASDVYKEDDYIRDFDLFMKKYFKPDES